MFKVSFRSTTWFAIATLAVAFANPAAADVLAGWDTSGASGWGSSPFAVTMSAANLAVGGLTRGGGVGTSGTAAARGWGGNTWTSSGEASAVAAGQTASFSVTANSGYQVSFTSISRLDYRRSASGPSSGMLQYQLGGGAFVDAATLSYASTSSSGSSVGAIDLSAIASLQNVPGGTTVTFRIVNFGGTSSSGTWYVFDTANSTANDLEISGSVTLGAGSVNGICGTANGQTLIAAPTTNLCSVGTASTVGGSRPWTWTCAGAGAGTTAACSANLSTAAPFTIFHMNDVHARITPHQWVINQHGSGPDVFEPVGGAAYLAGELLSLVAADPTALVLDGGDISEGNPIGDMNCATPQGGGVPVCTSNGFGNGGMTAVYALLQSKLTAIGGARGTRGIDALVVGNHDVRDASYITNMDQMRAAGVPVISANVRDIATGNPHFPATTTVTVNGVKVGIIGYTTSSAQVGASLASTLEVVDCQWTGSTVCNIADYVNDLRTNQHCDLVILLTHDGHSDLVDPTTPVIADTADAKVPEIAVTGHWHTWASTVWQPTQLNYKTIFTESSSYMAYIGELHVDGLGGYVSSTQHVLRNADITPDPDVAALVNNMIGQYNAAHPGHPVDEVVGYSNDDLLLDNRMKWWSADEYPWDGDNSAGQWITDGMKWACGNIAWPSGGGCDLAIEAGGGVRADIPAGPVTYMQVYETYPWSDDTYVRVAMTGQDIINFINATNLDTGFSSELDVTAFDGIITSVLLNGQPIGLSTVYKVAINNYMLAHPPGGYSWPSTVAAESDPANTLVRDSLPNFMRALHSTPATAYSVGGPRYHFNGQYSGGYRAVVTMMNDADGKTAFDDAFIRLLSATPETVGRLGSRQVPTSMVNPDGTVVASNRLAEQELYRSYLGFRTGVLSPGDIVEVLGKSSFYGGDPEFVDQEGIYGKATEFNIVGHDASLAKPAFMQSISAFLNDDHKNHYVKFLARKSAASTVVDQNGASLAIWDKTGYQAATLPGNVGDTLEITGVTTMESFALRFRSDSAIVSTDALPAQSGTQSHVDSLPAIATAGITLTATATVGGNGYALVPVADSEVASGSATANFGTNSNLYLESSTASGTFGVERAWLKFDLSVIPAGSTISSATLQLWNWKSTGAALPVEVRGASSDSWTETGITWNSQPAFGAVLDTQTLAAGSSNLWYYWNITAFVQGEFGGDQTASLVVKPVDENLAGGPSYGFDSKEYGSNTPVLTVLTQGAATSVASLSYFYRYSGDGASWSAWTAIGGPLSAAPYTSSFGFPNGQGYYEFYSVATDNLGHVEPTPVYAQSAVHYEAASGAAQTIAFGTLPATPVGSSATVSAVATSGLPVSIGTRTSTICSVSGSEVTLVAIGTCTLTADQAGDPGYFLAAPTATSSFLVTGLPQSIAFDAIAATLAVGSTTPLSARASSGLGVTFSSQTPSVCSVSGSTLLVVAAGTCIIAADQAGDGSYWAPAVTVTQSVSVGRMAQTINLPSLTPQTYGSGTITLAGSASSGLAVVYASQTPGVCSVSGSQITLLGAGTCTIVASQSGNGTYLPANATESFTVLPAENTSDGPLPLWAVGLLGLLLFASARRQLRA
jgi:2',3'-cyclic-nucleotide 2'-phosphodiesterase (5'-nucleotidase family)